MNPNACLICKSPEHISARCPQAFCERCGKLGHLASVCVEFLPWDCIAPMCAFSAKGQGFYYIHDSCTARQMKERETSVVITIVEGHTSTKDMEFDLSQYIATGWRCTARAIGPGVFIVRFPNRRDVSKACYTGRMTLKSTGTVVKIDPWTSALGAKGVMEKAWIKVSNVPLKKMNERNLAFVSSLVGVPLEIDGATLHPPEYVRMKIGCMNVDEIPPVAEAVLGDHFFNFYYELDQVMVRDPDHGKTTVTVPPESGNHTFKKMKIQTSNRKNEVGSSSNAAGTVIGSQCKGQEKQQGSPEDEGSDEYLDNTLLIDILAMEHDEAKRKKGKNDLSFGKQAFCENESGVFEGKGLSKYIVQSPGSSMDNENEVIPTPPLVMEENLCFSLRNAQTNVMRIDEKAAGVAKKRNLECNNSTSNTFDVLSDPELILRAVKMGVDIPDTDFASIDILRELEKSRVNALNNNNENVQDDNKSNNLFLINAKGDKTPLCMEWADEGNPESDTNDFTLVRSRNKKLGDLW
ncbi:uncharacterized protein [Triticum aestivum]|uniref:uncharacterized protein n=1 Tax=Triticum aestivum TaxID=4565 RepID=UPI001D011F13|nr:uncharacterized protein LOC123083690 [Triticum aestivum]